jgi:hypothetical protein
MRNELKDLVSTKYKLGNYDLSQTLEIAKNLYSGRLELQFKQLDRAKHEIKDERVYDAVVDDLVWYCHQETFFIWHFCLWRLQAVFEGIIVTKFLEIEHPEKLIGLKGKLDAMKNAGYIIEDDDYIEFLKWADVRNLLSHFPPSTHDPGPLDESDVQEYHDLCLRLYTTWSSDKSDRSYTKE